MQGKSSRLVQTFEAFSEAHAAISRTLSIIIMTAVGKIEIVNFVSLVANEGNFKATIENI